ncbi:perlucin-like protein [Trichomycterus rosablanca]|uniref:perlucin-like protein n=1 Tax=Trichomycterus rosablanca TaxID=2290929 RepID=UPI002F35B0EF
MRIKLCRHQAFSQAAQPVESNCSDRFRRLQPPRSREIITSLSPRRAGGADAMFFLITAKKSCELCDEGWRSLGLKCYFFSTNNLNWMASRDSCVEKGGHLVIITSQAEQDFLSSNIKETHWMGLNDLETEGKWMWVNNKTLDETGVKCWYTRTNQPSEPDNWREEDPSGENCACMGHLFGAVGDWFVVTCRRKQKYICEKQV